MKVLTQILKFFVAIFIVSLVSCKKTYTCACTGPKGGNDANYTVEAYSKYKNHRVIHEESAEKKCNSIENTYYTGSGTCEVQ